MATHRTVAIDVALIDEIENALSVDCCPSPDVIMPLMWRQEALDSRSWPRPAIPDLRLEDDIRKALDGGWLHLEEIAAIQRLRGWNRARRGTIVVDAFHLRDVRNVLGNLTLSLGSECDDQLAQLDYPEAADIREQVKARLAKDGTCGECLWCQVVRLGDECQDALDRLWGPSCRNCGHHPGCRCVCCHPRED